MTLFERHLTAADGYIELGLYLEANECLEDIEPELKATRVASSRREKIYAGLGIASALEVVQGALARWAGGEE